MGDDVEKLLHYYPSHAFKHQSSSYASLLTLPGLLLLVALAEEGVQLVPQLVLHVVGELHLPYARVGSDGLEEQSGEGGTHRVETDIVLDDQQVLAHEALQHVADQLDDRVAAGLEIQQLHASVR